MLKDLITINNFLSIILLAKSVVKDSGISMTFHRNIPHHCSTSHCYRPPTELRRLCFPYVSVRQSFCLAGGGGSHVTITYDALDFTVQALPRHWRHVQTCSPDDYPSHQYRHLVATTEPRTAGKWAIYILETRTGGNIWADPSLGRQHTMLDTPL